ncbi:MAG TPA: COX15/CtaA family protein [Thermoanaerobaculia bacterium]|nr:COX15/CtaA family protein [Thermoanaerobaculia bacterium]
MIRFHDEATPPWLRRHTKLVAVSTLFLLFAGAMVTSTGSGLAVPDWPLSYGMLMPPMVGGIFYEHGHRMIAAAVGFLTVLQAIWLQRREPKRFVRVLGWTALAAVVLQGVLGGLTVIFLLPPAISVAHAGLAEIFFCVTVAIAFYTSRSFEAIRREPRGDAPVAGAGAVVAIVFLQIVMGAVMRHLGAGLAIPDFPLSFGKWVPDLVSTAVAVNYAHRLGGLAVAIAALALSIRLRRYDARHPLRQMAALLLILVPAQILLGGYTVWSGRQPLITSLHVVTGALTLATAVVLWLSARTLGWGSERQAGPFVAGEVAA